MENTFFCPHFESEESSNSALTEGTKNLKENISKLANAVVSIGWCLSNFKQNLPASENYRLDFEGALHFQMSTLESIWNDLKSVEVTS